MKQKDEEILILEYFKKNYPDFPKGKLVKSESPDFIIKESPKKAIGIELTRLDPFAPSLKEKLDQTLQNKNSKIIIYQKLKLDEIWLIIYWESIVVPKSFNIQNKITNWTFSSKFDKAFLFDLFFNKIYKL